MIINNRFEEPYNKFPQDGPIPLLSKPIVISKLSKKFWLYTQYLKNENLIKSEESSNEKESQINNNYNYNDFPEDYIGEQFQGKDNINIRNNKNYKNRNMRPKSNNNYGNYMKKKNNFQNGNIDEINELNQIILRLQNELNRQDFIINSQINEKIKLTKRIHELEQVLNNFC